MNLKYLFLASTLAFTACVDPKEPDPEAEFKAFVQQEKEKAAKKSTKDQASNEDPHAEAKKDFATYCVSCHGEDGKANTPVAQAMNPKPRSLTDRNWQESVDDKRILKVIMEGGPSVGLAATMAPWGGILGKDKASNLVKYIRSLKQ